MNNCAIILKTLRIGLEKLSQCSVFVRLGVFIAIWFLCWVPIALALLRIFDNNPNRLTLVAMTTLGGLFILLVQGWGRGVYGQEEVFRTLGLEISPRNGREGLEGLGFGLSWIGGMYGLAGLGNWVEWSLPSYQFWPFILEGLAVGLGVGLAEELLFRGWLEEELERDFSSNRARIIGSVLFAGAHFLKPWAEIRRQGLSFPGLVLLGLALSWGRRSHGGRLGFPIGLHGGLVWGSYLLHVGGLIRPSDNVPEWIMGFGQNPLAGVMGVGMAGLLALLMHTQAHRRVFVR